MIDYSKKDVYDGDPEKYSVWHEAALRLLDFKNKNVLDIGCGSGGFLLYIKNSAKSVTGIDPNKENQKACLKNSLDVLCDYPENIHDMGLKFDIATCFEVIEHLYRHTEIVSAMSRMLCQGGMGIITTPNAFNIMRKIKFLFYNEHHDTLMDPTRSEQPEHIRAWSLGMMYRLCRGNSNLHVAKVYGVSKIFGKIFIFKNEVCINIFAQHLVAILKKI